MKSVLGLPVALLLFVLVAGGASAATLNVVGGQLLGASAVDVGGTLYDVEFLDGTCIALFDGCDSPSDFMFTTEAAALLAGQALMDQVFLDGVSGNFDTEPELINGCTDPNVCEALTPYEAVGINVFAADAQNNSGTDFVFPVFTLISNDTTVVGSSNYAVWSLTIVPPAPEPSFTLTQTGTTCFAFCQVGDTVDLELTIDASDLVGLGTTFGYGISILIAGDAVWGTVLAVDGGVGLQNTAQFEVDAGTFGIIGGLQLANAVEPNNDIIPTIVTMASFFGVNPAAPPGLDFTNAHNTNFVARVTLELLELGIGPTTFTVGAGPGDNFDLNGVDILDTFSFDSVQVVSAIGVPALGPIGLGVLLSTCTFVGIRRSSMSRSKGETAD